MTTKQEKDILMKEIMKDNIGTVKYPKSAFLKSKDYASKKDLITTLLDENIEYSKDETNKIIDTYLQKVVN